MHRWWTYLQERFPPLENGLLVAVFSVSALYHSAMLRGGMSLPGVGAALAAFALAFCFFFLLRVADEFKDLEKDNQYRPERPVPRGLIGLNELGAAGAAAALLQFAVAASLDAMLLLLLLGTWAYFALMSVEFFVPKWLEQRPLGYLLSHMLIMPGIALLASACDWAVVGAWPPSGFAWFLGASFFGGVVIEVGRKVRAPADERTGVDTYSKQWGVTGAVAAWLGALLLAGGTALGAARQVDLAAVVAGLLGGTFLVALLFAGRFVRAPTSKKAKAFEILSALWAFLLYGSLGLLPAVW